MTLHRPIVVTGTDTGVGKTVFTALLTHHLRQQADNVKVMKPFCSGERSDVEILKCAAASHAGLSDINPFFFEKPLAPLVAARNISTKITLKDCLERILEFVQGEGETLIEGAGGLLSPLGESFDLLDLVRELKSQVILVAPNRVGVINQVLLNIRELARAEVNDVCVILMGVKDPDVSAASNAVVIRELSGKSKVFELPWLGEEPVARPSLKKSYGRCEKVLAAIVPHP